MNSNPFFIVGCPRSGTTILRNVIKLDPNLDCPEETFFYRWTEPFGSDTFTKTYFNNHTIIKHRELDGITEEQFEGIYNSSNTRKELQNRYMEQFLKIKGNETIRWFDKTPQNIFGSLLLASDYVDSKFIHIYRHPLNVIASLSMGRMLAKHNLKAALNTWKESIAIANELTKFAPEKIINVKYEEFIKFPFKTLQTIGSFIDHDFSKIVIPKDMIGHGSQTRYKEAFEEGEINFILNQCSNEIKKLSYTQLPDQNEEI